MALPPALAVCKGLADKSLMDSLGDAAQKIRNVFFGIATFVIILITVIVVGILVGSALKKKFKK